MAEAHKSGVLIRAENGDVVGWDETGLVLHLSDRVIADIAARLSLPHMSDVAESGQSAAAPLDDDIDAWAVQAKGPWLHFQANLPGASGARGYIRHKDHPTIMAENHLPLMGIFALGGARAQLGSPLPARFPYHSFAPADDIGAAGMGGMGEARATPYLAPLREMTHEALLAEALLARRAGAGLPLFVLRAETDMAASATDLGQGAAIANLEQAMSNHAAAAAHLGKAAKIAAICLDFCLEDISGAGTGYRDGILAVMERLSRAAAALGHPRPTFLAGFDCGTQSITSGPALEGQWELAWNHGDFPLVFTAPSYAFALDDTGRLTDEGRRQKAEISAEALLAQEATGRWQCPTIQLAERAGHDIRLTCEAADALVIDAADPFGAGAAAGFALEGVTNKAVIKKVEVDPKDRKAVILRCSARPEGAVFVRYAHGAAAGKGPYPANAGALRDGWAAPGTHGPLHRWALPARLRLTEGA